MTTILRQFCTTLATSAILLSSVTANAGAPKLGKLTATDQVQVISQGVSFPVAQSEYILFGGDAVRTGAKVSAQVEFPHQGSLVVGFDTKMRFEARDDVLHLTLDQGAVRFSFGKGVAFVINAKDKIITSQTQLLQKVSDSTDDVRGVVAIANGKPVVLAESEGVYIRTGDNLQIASTGTWLSFDDESREFVQVVSVDQATTSLDDWCTDKPESSFCDDGAAKAEAAKELAAGNVVQVAGVLGLIGAAFLLQENGKLKCEGAGCY
jgi:hypothetical protein